MNAGHPYSERRSEWELETIKGSALRSTPRVEIVEGMIVKRARPTSLYALPGVGKGNFAIYVLLCALYRLPMLGKPTRPIDWAGYVDGEDDQSEFARRARRIAAGLGVELDDRLCYVEVPYKLDPSRIEFVERQLADWATLGAGLVAYDSAQALFGGNQNSGEVGDEVYSTLKNWGQRYNNTPLVIDHAAWAGRHEIGSVFKRARVGASLYLVQREAVSDRETIIDLFNPKSNTRVVNTGKDAAPVLSMKITFEGDDDGGPIRFALAEPPGAADAESMIMGSPDALPGTYKEIAAHLGLNEGTVRNALGRLKRQGRVENERAAWQRTQC